jgi:hypothetical protein
LHRRHNRQRVGEQSLSGGVNAPRFGDALVCEASAGEICAGTEVLAFRAEDDSSRTSAGSKFGAEVGKGREDVDVEEIRRRSMHLDDGNMADVAYRNGVGHPIMIPSCG